MLPQRFLIKTDPAVLHIAQTAQLTSLKGIDVGRIRLFDETGAVDDAVHNDDNTAVSQLCIGSGLNGFQEIQRAVGTDSRRRSHGSGKDDGLASMDGKIEIISRFLHRIRPVGDDDAVDVLPFGHFLHAGSQGLPQGFGHVRAVNIDELLALHIGIVMDSRHSVQQLSD